MGLNLSLDVAGMKVKNPLTVASGTFGAGESFADFYDPSILGAVTTKGVSSVPWQGNDGVRMAETASGMLNSIGLQNPGVEGFVQAEAEWLSSLDTRVIINVCGHSTEEYEAVIERLEAEDFVDAYELNISCPNVSTGGMSLGTCPTSVEQVVAACKSHTSRPLIVKLSPNVTSIADIARAAEAGGADALSLINTLLGMAINPYTRKPVLGRVVGGLSGPAIKPVALRCVWEASRAVNLPIIGMGGVASGLDVVEFMLAGASMVAVGAANFGNPLAVPQILKEFIRFCESEGIKSADELIGGLE